MFAHDGDRILVHGRHVGEVTRTGTIVEVRGNAGNPPYLVRWEHSEALCLVYPGPDAEVSHSESPESER